MSQSIIGETLKRNGLQQLHQRLSLISIEGLGQIHEIDKARIQRLTLRNHGLKGLQQLLLTKIRKNVTTSHYQHDSVLSNKKQKNQNQGQIKSGTN